MSARKAYAADFIGIVVYFFLLTFTPLLVLAFLRGLTRKKNAALRRKVLRRSWGSSDRPANGGKNRIRETVQNSAVIFTEGFRVGRKQLDQADSLPAGNDWAREN